MDRTSTARRRRGTALEDAILEAAWQELAEHGYADFTLEATARRAGTSRPVLSRRWPNRADLAGAAIKHHISQVPVVVPDMGNLRDELTSLMRQLSARGTPTLITLVLNMSDYFVETDTSFAELKQAVTAGGAIDSVLQRGIARGEIDPTRLTPRISALPIDLARQEAMMNLGPVSDQAIAEIIDQIFLPLVSRPDHGGSAATFAGK